MRRKTIIFIICILALLLQACAPQPNAEHRIVAENGILNLHAWQPDEHMVNLNGEWEFYWKQLLEPEDFQNKQINKTEYIEMPSNWHTYDGMEEELSKDGYATFRLQVSLDKQPENVISLYLPIMYSNYRIWIDDTLVAESGEVGTTKETSVATKETQIIPIAPKDKDFTITLQISNFHNYAGGMWDPIQIGDAINIQQNYIKSVILQALLLGILLLSGLYHLGLNYFRRTESYFFYFGTFCLSMAIHYLMSGNVFLTKLWPTIDWELATKIEYISLYANFSLLSMFLYRLYPKESSRKFTLGAGVITAIYTLITIVTNAKFYYQLLSLFQLAIFIGVIYGMVVIIKVVSRRREGGVYALVGIFGLMTTFVVDTTRFLFQYSDIYLYPFGIFIFIICLSLLLSKRLSTSLDLSIQLSEDLKLLNERLEAKVEERTEQIQRSHQKLEQLNSKLKNMALIDGLTEIPNRRQLDEFLQREFESCRQSKQPISLILIDIDNFKLYNDHYGHQQGDRCLRKVAKTLQNITSSYPDTFTARYGGEEFVCVLPRYELDQTKQIAEKLRHRVQRLQIPHEKSSASMFVTVSLGLATFTPTEELTSKNLIDLADKALYEAKAQGKNQVICCPHLTEQNERDFPAQ